LQLESHRFQGGVFSPQKQQWSAAKTIITGSDTGSVRLTPDPTRPDPAKIVDPVTCDPWPGSNTAEHPDAVPKCWADSRKLC